MKIQSNNKLDFKKKSIVELSNNELHDINGGGITITVTTAICVILVASVVIATITRSK